MKNKLLLFWALLILLSTTTNIRVSGLSEFNPLIFADIIITSDYNGFAISCAGASDGSAIVYPTGGLAPYEFLWSNGFIGQEATGLAEGIYSITVVDATLSTIIVEAIISGPTPLELYISQINTDSLEIIVTGGVPPYNYIWSTGDTSPNLGSLNPGLYSVTINDLNGCSESVNYNLSNQAIGPDWEYTITNENHTIIIPDTIEFIINGDPAQPGDIIGVFFDSLGTLSCGGYIIWDGVTTAISAYGDDPLTTDIDGFIPGEELKWKVWDNSENEVFLADPIYDLTNFQNDSYYLTNGISGLISLHGYSQQMVSIPTGWSIMSTYIDPIYPNLENIFSELLQDIIIIKNENGELYYPDWNLNMIGEITIGEGYEIKMNNNGGLKTGFVLIVNGEKINSDTGIELPEGWSIISYFHKETFLIEDMLQSIDSVISIVKDGNGNVYIPNPPSGPAVNTIIDMNPGKGYKIKILAGNNVILTYPDSLPGMTKSDQFIQPDTNYKHFAKVSNTGNNHSFIIAFEAYNGVINLSDEIGIFTNGKLVGSEIFNGKNLVIPVFGDDETTPTIDGAITGKEITIKLWDSRHNQEYELTNIEWIKGDRFYHKDKISIINGFDYELSDTTEGSFNIYPNPNNGIFSISIKNKDEILKIEITNIEGKIIYSKVNYKNIETKFDFSQFDAGSYYMKIITEKTSFVKTFIVQ